MSFQTIEDLTGKFQEFYNNQIGFVNRQDYNLYGLYNGLSFHLDQQIVIPLGQEMEAVTPVADTQKGKKSRLLRIINHYNYGAFKEQIMLAFNILEHVYYQTKEQKKDQKGKRFTNDDIMALPPFEGKYRLDLDTFKKILHEVVRFEAHLCGGLFVGDFFKELPSFPTLGDEDDDMMTIPDDELDLTVEPDSEVVPVMVVIDNALYMRPHADTLKRVLGQLDKMIADNARARRMISLYVATCANGFAELTSFHKMGREDSMGFLGLVDVELKGLTRMGEAINRTLDEWQSNLDRFHEDSDNFKSWLVVISNGNWPDHVNPGLQGAIERLERLVDSRDMETRAIYLTQPGQKLPQEWMENLRSVGSLVIDSSPEALAGFFSTVTASSNPSAYSIGERPFEVNGEISFS